MKLGNLGAVAVFLLIEPSESLGIMAAVISIFVLAIVFLYLCLHFFADFVHNVDEVRFVNNMHPQLPGACLLREIGFRV